MADRKKTAAYKRLKNGLQDSLEARGLVEPAYTDLLEHYMVLWCQLQDLREDIEERGVTVDDLKRGLVENRSVVLEMQVSRQMLQIWTALGFRDLAAQALPAAEEDDEL